MKTLNSTQFIEACRLALKGWQEDPEKAAKTIAFDISLVEDAHPMLHLVSSKAWYLQEVGLDAPTVDTDSEYAEITTLMKRYEANDWLDTKWSICFTYSSGDEDYVNVVLHADTNGYSVESGEAVLKKAVEQAVGNVNKKQTSEWFIKSCSKISPRQVGRFTYKYSDISQSLNTDSSNI